MTLTGMGTADVDSGSVAKVARRAERRALTESEPTRVAAIEAAKASAPEDPFLAVAYWAELRDEAEEELLDAAVRARRAGLTWHVIGMAYGDRTAQAAQQKFGPLVDG